MPPRTRISGPSLLKQAPPLFSRKQVSYLSAVWRVAFSRLEMRRRDPIFTPYRKHYIGLRTFPVVELRATDYSVGFLRFRNRYVSFLV